LSLKEAIDEAHQQPSWAAKTFESLAVSSAIFAADLRVSEMG
jgi:hypothetical protein